jgi:hypothetical protein
LQRLQWRHQKLRESKIVQGCSNKRLYHVILRVASLFVVVMPLGYALNALGPASAFPKDASALCAPRTTTKKLILACTHSMVLSL